MNCPHCNRPVVLIAPKTPHNAPGGQWQASQAFNSTSEPPFLNSATAAPAIGDFVSYERRAPARPASLESDVLVPLAQSALTGIIIATPTAAAAAVMGYYWVDSLVIGGVVGTVVVTITWLVRMDAHSKLLWLVENVTGRDLDGDGKTVPPPAPPVQIEVSHTAPNGNLQRMLLFELPDGITEKTFHNWIAAVTNDGIHTLARSHWVGRGKPFSRSQYDNFLKELERAGLVHNVGDGRGRQLTNGGKRALKRQLTAK